MARGTPQAKSVQPHIVLSTLFVKELTATRRITRCQQFRFHFQTKCTPHVPRFVTLPLSVFITLSRSHSHPSKTATQFFVHLLGIVVRLAHHLNEDLNVVTTETVQHDTIQVRRDFHGMNLDTVRLQITKIIGNKGVIP